MRTIVESEPRRSSATRWRPATGTPQGGVISPLLANVYLDRLDRAWGARGRGVLCRYADDLVVMCATEWQARDALAAVRVILAELGLEPKEDKTRIVHLTEGGEGFDFLGFHHRWVRGRGPRSRHLRFLARWPSRQAVRHARARVRELTARSRLRVPVETIVAQVNAFLRGWTGYFRYGNSARTFDAIRRHALLRLVLFVAHRHKQDRWFGWEVISRSTDHLGLISLDGRVIAPRPTAGGGRNRMPSVKDVGEPCAGEPRARFDDGGGRKPDQSGGLLCGPGASRRPDRN